MRKKTLLPIYTPASVSPSRLPLFGPDHLQLSGNMGEVVRVRLGDKLARIGLLHKILIALLVRESDGIFLGLELYPVAVHEVGG
jgi:hypothetical protein